MLMKYLDSTTLHFYRVDYFDLPTWYDSVFKPTSAIKFEHADITLRKFRAMFMEEHHAFKFKKAPPQLAYAICSKCGDEHLISKKYFLTRQACCPGVRSFCSLCYASPYTHLVCEEDWSDDAPPTPCKLLHKTFQPQYSLYQHKNEPMDTDFIDHWDPHIFDQ